MCLHVRVRACVCQCEYVSVNTYARAYAPVCITGIDIRTCVDARVYACARASDESKGADDAVDSASVRVFARAQVDEKAMDARKKRGRHQLGTASGAAGAVAANQAILSSFEKQVAAAEKQVMCRSKLPT